MTSPFLENLVKWERENAKKHSMDKLERCGFCGVYFRGSENLTDEEIKKLSEKELNEAPLGYCSNANQENEMQT